MIIIIISNKKWMPGDNDHPMEGCHKEEVKPKKKEHTQRIYNLFFLEKGVLYPHPTEMVTDSKVKRNFNLEYQMDIG